MPNQPSTEYTDPPTSYLFNISPVSSKTVLLCTWSLVLNVDDSARSALLKINVSFLKFGLKTMQTIRIFSAHALNLAHFLES